jgi:hypothetical protein
MKLYKFAFGLLISAPLAAQNITDPVLTEVWSPVPRIITTTQPNNVPSDAVILFNGVTLENWVTIKDNSKAQWTVQDGAFTVKPGTGDIKSKEKFGSCQLHIEFKTPPATEKTGQGRGNSGIFLQELYELQLLDNYNNPTYSNGQCGSIYKQTMPLANACKAPGEWQTYDVIYKAPEFNADGIKTSSAYITVLHNGVLVQNHTEIKGTTEYIGMPKNESHGKGALKLQDHGNFISFRNIWVRPL